MRCVVATYLWQKKIASASPQTWRKKIATTKLMEWNSNKKKIRIGRDTGTAHRYSFWNGMDWIGTLVQKTVEQMRTFKWKNYRWRIAGTDLVNEKKPTHETLNRTEIKTDLHTIEMAKKKMKSE